MVNDRPMMFSNVSMDAEDRMTVELSLTVQLEGRDRQRTIVQIMQHMDTLLRSACDLPSLDIARALLQWLHHKPVDRDVRISTHG